MNDILDMLTDGNARTTKELSEALGLAPAMVAAQIEYLEQMGYLQKVTFGNNCSGSCSSCSKDCGSNQTGNVLFTAWEITARR